MPEGEYSYTISEKNKMAKEIRVMIDKDKIFSNGNYTLLE
jgi:hypothetical protein